MKQLRSINLSLKLTICLIGGMAIIFSALGYQNVKLHRQQLEDMTFAAGDRISDTIKRSTRFGMLNNHRDQVHQTISAIASQPGMNKIRIYNEEGKVSFSTDENEAASQVDKKAEACYGCHAEQQPLARLNRPDRTRIYAGPNGERILGLINPIENEPSCSNADCHAHPASQQILGVVDVTMSLAKVDETIAAGGRQMITNLIGAILIISLMVGTLMWVMVNRPVKRLIIGTKRVAAGDLDYKIRASSQDEVGELAMSFNRMTGELKQANDEINEWARTLESRVEDKTGELKQAHEQMLHVERMASIGKLAAIVAHEINNPLAGILVYSKLLLKKLAGGGAAPGGEESKQYLSMIASESARCGEIVKNLLQFSRQAKVNPEPNDINELIQQSLRLIQHKIDLMGITTDVQLDGDLNHVVCDAQQIKQALVALLINACEAMKQGEGQLEITSRHLAGRCAIEIEVTDNGVGMDEETKKQIFEPFFTTKEEGKGVGLGLAVVYGIVNGHSGEIEVKSSPGLGTTFVIRLPENNSSEVKTGARIGANTTRERPSHPFDDVLSEGFMATNSDTRILIVDDETIVRESLGSWFREEGYSVDVAASAREALEKLSQAAWDIFLLDIRMPGMTGLELQRKIKEAHPDSTIIIMTAYASVETAVEAMKQGAYDYIVKPFDPDDLEHLVRNAIERKQLVSENIQLRSKIDEMNLFHEVVGKSDAMRRVLEQVAMVSASDTTALIRGESGTGKELIARAIHANSPRRYLPIVVVNCGSLSEGVLESELFGHEKGAFTGAHYRRKGKFEMADGGTLFLDEIGDINLKTQVDLLRVLEEKKITRVGGNAEIPVDFRLIAATNKDLEAMTAEGKFREDLYYRVNVFSIAIPPLRERREDIGPLVEHFVKRFTQSMNKPIRRLAPETMELMRGFDWPGNVRELQNAIERAVLVCKTKEIQPEDLPLQVSDSRGKASNGKSLSDVERQHVKKVLEETGWNVYQAARLLEIDRVTLYNKIKKYGFKRVEK